MPIYFRETTKEKTCSTQPTHSSDDDIDSARLEIGLAPDTAFGDSHVSLNQIQEYKFWKEHISQYYKWMVVVKEHLKRLDLTLKSMDSAETANINLAKNIGSTALHSILNIGGAVTGGAIGGAIGTAIPVPVIGTIVGAASGFGLSYLNNIVIKKLNNKLRIAHPYPKTRNMIFDINNYDKNPITKIIKNETDKNNMKVTAANMLTSQVVNQITPIKIPVYKLADLAVSRHKASGKLSSDKAEHILDFTKKISEVLNESHSDAVTFMRKEYGDNKMSLTGFSSRIKGEKLTADTMVRTKNKIEIKINSIDKQILKLLSKNSDI
ncbi:hypothetical protein FE394_09985 [Xenorhabdus sp. Reich]|uniref:Uncharacterized protein n=1 Tax=Xenorhabdus littoralis TaxID=2582835 RepID=A0ABU4SLK5_9GAMM|nr:hypothetical protein [Xenorhabdus sp. Reich]MDX7999524.1 hypothetical protein [Xenorhabdus sp. Reich]